MPMVTLPEARWTGTTPAASAVAVTPGMAAAVIAAATFAPCGGASVPAATAPIVTPLTENVPAAIGPKVVGAAPTAGDALVVGFVASLSFASSSLAAFSFLV